ncbi:hypothetical protein DES40_2350 [Litorimonas taeanensis]|uniref:Uncharacterized protein n=1 Tax=Litorimonas taeanensis TaxID=568099 RepID=A0A420WF03_9PROT|nr:hypothetical protein [Litorimonas taeanensis]RKQ69549.1 hypothetical protein DES40_2350 [Litorimonas taeanensis]
MKQHAEIESEFKEGLTHRVVAVIRSIESTAGWDHSSKQNETYLYILRAAQNVGCLEPFSKEQSALNNYLQFKKAGRKMCDYAWRLLAQSQ